MTQYLLRGTQKRTETVSFRINPVLRTGLEDEARKVGVNLNTLVSQIFSRYMTWERYAGQLKFLPVSKDLLREVFQSMQRETVELKQANIGAVLKFIDLWGSHFEACDHNYDGKKHFFTLHHDVNLNFSIFVKEYVSTMIQSTVARIVQFETVSPNSVTFSFDG
ncbi:MAG: hypothetical protein AUJ07_03775 [Crenarchaeota archaeon 13_1_40CM_3_53_5]|nr:MAG: hypothetical protein AUJ07_03775 [Crenarchaeota archaeon 13_1_40CM_3_53_5]